jgi:galactokinase/mevalonate kinase-like predicted kinase
MQTLISLPESLVHSFHAITEHGPEEWFVLADPKGARVGSGGGTAHLLAEHKRRRMKDAGFGEYLGLGKRVIIHAGGQSRRLPAYAPSGKLLAPIPVFRWSRGQRMDQTLLDLQMPLLEKVMEATGPGQNTLVAAGDVLILSAEVPFALPGADVVCLGMWVDPHLASRHGVLFALRERPRQLDFMLQKPVYGVIERLAGTHLYLMDVGIWVLSDRAVELLMKKCGWRGSGFAQGVPTYYDLYSMFGTCLGEHPSETDEEIRELSTALVSLDRGEFHHYGTSAELISSTEKIQNRVEDQRHIWHNRVKPDPSLFVMNANTDIAWEGHHHIWIENSHVPATWRLQHDHMLTGIPENAWAVSLEAGVCLDIVPVGETGFCIRPYGMEDVFQGAVGGERTLWMGKPAGDWLAARSITGEEAGISGAMDIQMAPLFPVVERRELTGELIRWMLGPEASGKQREVWLARERLSAEQISQRANMVRLFKQRTELRQENLVKLAANYRRSVFYQADLRHAAQDYARAGHALPAALPETEQAVLLFRDHMFRSEVLRRKGLDGAAEEGRAFEVLRRAITGGLSGRVAPRLNVQADQIVWGRSPARLDLAGGWSDTPPYCLQSGGSVVNVAVELNGQPPIQVYIRSCPEKKIVLRSIDTGAAEEIHTCEALRTFDQVGSAFSIPKAALYLAGFHPDRCEIRYGSLEEQLEAFGGGFEISLLAAIPKGSGLGTSSILAATILGSLADFCALNWDHQAICHRTLVLEQLLTTGGGWQDQYGGILSGIKLLESEPGTQERISVRWLPDRLFTQPEYKDCWLLYYAGVTRVAKNILADIVRGMFLNEGRRLRIVDEIRQHAYRMAEAVQRSDLGGLGRMVARSWKLNNALDSGTNTPEVQRIIDLIGDYAIGYKLLGAGGGGYLLICAKDPEAAVRIQSVLTQNPPTAKARFVKMEVSPKGFQVSRS